jgi:2,4-dienoyl-CoA reductase (NADPH2)
VSEHEPFRYNSIQELQSAVEALGLGGDIGFESALTSLHKEVPVGPATAPNALAVHPMEGHDSLVDGAPSHLTRRRYERYARGGAGLIWMEATAVRPEWRAHPRQLCLTAQNAAAFGALREDIVKWHQEGGGAEPVVVLQLTHSGRFTRPGQDRTPIIPFHDPLLDPVAGIGDEYPVMTDADLAKAEDAFCSAARLARDIGFTCVDIKSCHRYLSSELLAGYTRPGKYGGSFDNRTRFLINTVQGIRSSVGDGLALGIRLNAYDHLPYPYGWGVDHEDYHKEDLTEPVRLVRLLTEWGVSLINITLGTPYYNPFVGRPFDRPVRGAANAPEHPLVGVARFFRITERVQRAVPDTRVLGAGYTWLRQYAGQAAAYNLTRGRVSMVGLGRGAVAYPEFARDLLDKGRLDETRVCITCSKCSQMMIEGGPVGCAVRDGDMYRNRDYPTG